MNDYDKSNVRSAKYFFGAVMFIMALSFMANQSPGVMAVAEIKGQTIDADTISHWKMKLDSTEQLEVGTVGETYNADYDNDGWPVRGYLSSDEIKMKHLKTKKQKKRFTRRKARVYKDFVDTMGRKALEISLYFSEKKGIDIPPSVILAQAISESRYGTSRLAVQGNNYFGVQYRGKRKGIVGPINAKDMDHSKKLQTYGFAKYESTWWSLFHHAMLLKKTYSRRLLKVDIPLREQYFAAICGCDDSRMLASDAKAERTSGGYYYAAACEYVAKDGKTSKYVATLKYLVRLHNMKKLDEEWRTRKYKH